MNRSASAHPGKPLRIAFAVSSLHGGGAERVALALARGLVARGHRVDLVLFDMRIHYPEWIPFEARLFVADETADRATKDRPAYDDLRQRIIRVRPYRPRWHDRIRLARALKWNFSAFPTKDKFRKTCQMAGYIRQAEPDIILPSLISATVSALLARHFVSPHPPVIPIVHSLMKRRRKGKAVKYSTLFAEAARVVAVSNGVGDSVRRETGIAADKLVTIYNPVIPPELERLKSQQPCHPWFADNGPPVILACGRLKKVKDFPTLLKAFAQLSRRRRYRLIILGEGEQRKPVEDLVRRLNLQREVSMPGWTDNPFAFMSRAALFVLSSRTEGLPTALIEALACGCPCVSTDCPSGPAEILQGGEIGPLVPVGDHTALADAMLRTLDNPPDRQKLLARARFFSVERAVKGYEDLIRAGVR